MDIRALSGRWVRIVVVAGLLIPTAGVASAASAAVATPTAAPAAKQASIQWKPCGTENPGYDCASVKVPLDYDRPSGGTTQIALSRFPATDKQHRIGTVFVNPGG